MKMQQNFIDELENRGKQNIAENKSKITKLMSEVDQYLQDNTKLQESLESTTKQQEEVAGATKVIETKHTSRKTLPESICYYERAQILYG